MTVDRAELVSHAIALKGASLLCVGDVMLDRFIHGDVERISPEAPIPVLRIARETAMLGGAGNVVRNVAALGAASRFVAVIGEDEAGREIGRLVGAEPLISSTLLEEASRPTTIKVRFFASHQQLLRVDRETQDDLPDGVRERLLTATRPLFEGVGAVILSDYGKGVLSSESVRRLIDAARAAGKPVVVDPKGTDYTIYRGATVVTPNRKELHQATGMPVDSDGEIVAAATHLIENCGIESVLATRSQDGMSLVTRQGRVYHLPAEAREVFDVSGAGDTVVATLAAALATGAPLAMAARLANVAAGIVVAKVGTAVARSDELLAALSHGDAMAGQAKIATRDKACERVEAWRRKGKTVGFTNGCFDLLHPGHVSLLSQAKSHCDRLVVGLNSDDSVKRLKGPARPVQDEVARATVLAALAAVDLVVVFGEDTPLETIRALAPDVLVKGADYTIDKVVGADFVLARGGRVVLADLVAGQSTTATIGRMTR